MKKILIIGAGVTGLSAAYKLADNHEVTVIEKEDEVGGLSRSIREKGYFFDIGPHAFHTDNKKILDDFRSIMDEEVMTTEKDVLINHMGKYYKYPLKPLNVLLTMNPIHSMWCIINLLYAKAKTTMFAPKDRSAEEWLRNRFGTPLYKLFFKGYTTKVWGVHPKKLSALFTQHRIPTINFRDMLLRGILNIKKSFDDGHKFAPQVYKIFYPKRKGIGLFLEKLKEKVIDKGGKVMTQTKLSRISVKNNNVTSVIVEDQEKRYSISPDMVISTIPIDELVNRIEPKPNFKNVSLLEYRALLVICIIVKKKQVFKPLHFYFRDKFFHRLSELKNFNSDLFPKDKTGLMAEVTCDFNDTLWKSKDKDILDKAMKDLKSLGFLEQDEIEDYFIIRVRNAYPRYGVGFDKALNDISRYMGNIKNMYSIGRQGLFRYIDMDRCMENGFILAERINKGLQKEKFSSFDIEDTPYM